MRPRIHELDVSDPTSQGGGPDWRGTPEPALGERSRRDRRLSPRLGRRTIIGLAVAVVAALGLAVVGTTVGGPIFNDDVSAVSGSQNSRLMVSRYANRSDAVPLQGATLVKARFVFVTGPRQVDRVAFYVDGKRYGVDEDAPFDLAGTRPDSGAKVLNTRDLAEGEHTFEARVTTRDGKTGTLRAKAVVDNKAGPAPGPSATQPPPKPTPGVPGGGPGPTTGPVTGLKPTTTGLVDRKGAPPGSVAGILNAWVVNVSWAQLQSGPGASITADNPVDRAIAAVRSAGSKQQIKIRYVGEQPGWVKQLGGTPVAIADPVDGRNVTVGRFWSGAFGAAYEDLQAKMAAKYDGVAEVVDVTIARCTTVYAEPFIRQIADASTRSALVGAGYTEALDRQCHREQIEAHSVWKRTRSSLAANPMQLIKANGTGITSVDATIEMLKYCRSTLGNRCVLENNSAGVSTITGSGDYPKMYAAMFQLGGATTIQTKTAAKIGDLKAVLSWAATNGVTAVELPSGYEKMISVTELQDFDRKITANSTTMMAAGR